MRPLTPSQRSTLTFFHRHRDRGVQSAFIGVEAETDCPVVAVRDRRRFFVMAVCPDGAGRDPRGEIRQLADDEFVDMEVDDNICLTMFPTEIKETA